MADEIITINPLDIFAYFNKADFIITDTFHGTIFSIKANKKFCTIIRSSNKNKLMDLLNRLNLSNRAIKNVKEIEYMWNVEIDYKETNKIIEREKIKTREYLEKNI